MSKRRKVGDWVWLKGNCGFVGDSDKLKAEIRDDGCMGCFSKCGDEDCVEWSTLWTEPDNNDDGKRHMLCHVSECEMFDDKP